MLKFIVRTVLFMAFASTMYVVAVFLFGHFAPNELKPNISSRLGAYGHLYSRLREVKTVTNVDVLFLGSSHAYRGFDTRIFERQGFTAFNLGSSAQTPMQTQVLIDRYLDQLNPKTVVYEVYPVTFTLDGIESAIDLVSNDQNDLSSFRMSLQTRNIKALNAFLFASTSQLLGLHGQYNEPRLKGNDTYIPGGFVERKLLAFERSAESIAVAPLRIAQLQCFQHNIEELKSRGIRVVLVYAPIPKVSYKNLAHQALFDQLMHAHGEYYNFNARLQLNDSLHFYDADHLNQRGVERFNAALLEVLSQ